MFPEIQEEPLCGMSQLQGAAKISPPNNGSFHFAPLVFFSKLLACHHQKGGEKNFHAFRKLRTPTEFPSKFEGREVRAIIEVLALLHWTHHASTGIMAAYLEDCEWHPLLFDCLFKTLHKKQVSLWVPREFMEILCFFLVIDVYNLFIFLFLC